MIQAQAIDIVLLILAPLLAGVCIALTFRAQSRKDWVGIGLGVFGTGLYMSLLIEVILKFNPLP
jgi:uncharacterized membrane protein YjjB (DUF3815 family)